MPDNIALRAIITATLEHLVKNGIEYHRTGSYSVDGFSTYRLYRPADGVERPAEPGLGTYLCHLVFSDELATVSCLLLGTPTSWTECYFADPQFLEVLAQAINRYDYSESMGRVSGDL